MVHGGRVLKLSTGLLALVFTMQAQSGTAPSRLREQAWTAWRAGAAHDSSSRELLLEWLRAGRGMNSSAYGSDEYAYVQALLDALVQIPGPVAADVVLPFAESWRAEVLILLSRDPAAPGVEAALLDMRDRSLPNAQLIAVGDLLFGISSKAFFRKTLEEIEITHQFEVRDARGGGVGGGMGGGVSCCVSGSRGPAGFPPVALYALTAAGSPGDVVFRLSPVPVYYRRVVVGADGSPAGSGCGGDDLTFASRQALPVRFFAAAGGVTAEATGKIFHANTWITWQGEAEASNEMARALDEQAGAVQALVAEVARRNLIEASGMRLNIAVTIRDYREKKEEALPGIARREILLP
jgi:hypothetical protein